MSGEYRTILADPPWDYGDGFAGYGTDRLAREALPYPSMTLDEIKALPVADLAHPDGAWLWLWTTNRYLPASFGVLEAWGFKYGQTLVWWKHGPGIPFKATVAPIRCEFLLVARRGKPPKLGTIRSSVLPYKGGGGNLEHSQKPEAFQHMIEQVAPGPYLEMFARRKLKRWDSWGNEVESDVAIEAAA